MFSAFDVDLVWRCQFFTFCERRHLLPSLLPKQLFVTPLPVADWPDVQFWPLPPRRGRRRTKKPRVSADTQEVDGGEGQSDECPEPQASDGASDDIVAGVAGSDGSSDDAGCQDNLGSESEANSDDVAANGPGVPGQAAAAEPGVVPIPDDGAGDVAMPLVSAQVDREEDHPAMPWVRCEIPDRGSITWYRCNGDFVASCNVAAHGGMCKCKKTRTSAAPGRLRRTRQAQGRPLGHLMAWLEGQADPAFTGQRLHHAYAPPYAARVAAREALKQLPGSEGLFDAERPKNEGEGSEPEALA